MRIERIVFSALAATLWLGAQTGTEGLFRAIRNDDLAAIKVALKDTSGVNAVDQRGTTALMYAAAFGSDSAFRLLLDAGASVNASNSAGHTALLYAVNQPSKMRMLLDKGAEVPARTKRGNTALHAAAAQQGNVEWVKRLVAKGADPKAANAAGVTALVAASIANDTETIRFLLERGADPNAATRAGDRALEYAAGNGTLEAVKLLLAKGADVNAANTDAGVVKNGKIALRELTALILAAPHSDPRVVGALLDAGAKVNVKDGRGMTPLMLAVASERQDADVVKLLLARGADVNMKSTDGETALDWALKFGNPDVIAELKRAGGVAAVKPAAAPAPVPAQDGRTAVAKGLGILQRTSTSFFRNSGCAACHHSNLTAVAVAAARRRGIPVDEPTAAEQLKTVKFGSALFGAGYLEREDGPTIDILLYALLGMGAEQYQPDETTDTMVFNIAAQQESDGAWRRAGISRAPIEEGHIARTALAIYALRTFGMPGRRVEFGSRIARALAWIEKAPAQTTDDRSMLLMGLKWGGAGTGRIAAAAKALAAAQREDGGWSGNRHLPSDAYATGEALYALHESGSAVAHVDAVRRGSAYLLRTQAGDGSWFMRSRAPKFQPYFESGFPYGHDQWISAAATAWATAGLAAGLPISSAKLGRTGATLRPLPRAVQNPENRDRRGLHFVDGHER